MSHLFFLFPLPGCLRRRVKVITTQRAESADQLLVGDALPKNLVRNDEVIHSASIEPLAEGEDGLGPYKLIKNGRIFGYSGERTLAAFNSYAEKLSREEDDSD